MLKSELKFHRNIKNFYYPFLGGFFTIVFSYMAIPIANEYRSKNYCISKSFKQLQEKHTSSNINMNISFWNDKKRKRRDPRIEFEIKNDDTYIFCAVRRITVSNKCQ